MTLGAGAFAVLVWGSLASVVVTFGCLLWIVLREDVTGRRARSVGRRAER
jgi:hypothetical protein